MKKAIIKFEKGFIPPPIHLKEISFWHYFNPGNLYAKKSGSRKLVKGFTIAEVVIAGFVLTTGIVAVLGLMSASTAESFQTRNSIIASELAQEGIELIRNFRDNEMVVGDYEMGDDFELLGICRIDYNDVFDAHNNCTLGGDYNNYLLKFNANGLYDHGVGGTATRFARVIDIEDSGLGDSQVIVRSIVTWDGQLRSFDDCNIGNNCVKIEDRLTNWK